MAITGYFTKTAEVFRLDNNGDFVSQVTTTCHVQPFNGESGSLSDYIIGQDFLIFTNETDVMEGDHLVISAETFRVISSENFDDFRGQRHLEIIARKQQT